MVAGENASLQPDRIVKYTYILYEEQERKVKMMQGRVDVATFMYPILTRCSDPESWPFLSVERSWVWWGGIFNRSYSSAPPRLCIKKIRSRHL